MSVSTSITALRGLQRYFEELPDVAEQAASLAINDTVGGKGMTLLKNAMYDDVAFPKGYVESNLSVTKNAGPKDLTAIISGRFEPTSLARFADPGQTPGNTRRRGVRVRVKGRDGGSTQVLTGAFLMRLRNGNLGLAIRLPIDKTPDKTYSARPFTVNGGQPTGVWLLYGPSVNQVLNGVATDNQETLMDMIESRFYRQFGRLSRAR